jgi:hypothetical protein
MHLPKLLLRACGLGGFRRSLGERMYLRKWEVAKDETQPLTHQPLDIFDNIVCCATMRTFKVAVFD